MQSWAPRLCPIQVTRVGENEVNAYVRDLRTANFGDRSVWGFQTVLALVGDWSVDPLLTLNPSDIEVRDQPAAYQKLLVYNQSVCLIFSNRHE